jgi:hypothetical protein
MTLIQNEVTSELIEQNLQSKYRIHNSVAKECRDKVILSAQQTKKRKWCEHSMSVGFDCASQLSLDSLIRVSQPQEKESVIIEEGHLRGLHVREETSQVLLGILTKLKQKPSTRIKVKDLCDLHSDPAADLRMGGMICDFTLLSFARCCVELGAFAVVEL